MFPNGNRYEGYYVESKPEGKGLYKWSNGEIYDGEWYQGKKNGSGITVIALFSNKKVYGKA